MIRKTILAAMFAASIGAAATSASAVVYVRVAPPEPRVEVVPEPRHNRTWVAGHWQWKNHKHVWVKGAWVKDRPGYRYNQPAWAERDGKWYMTQGHYSR